MKNVRNQVMKFTLVFIFITISSLSISAQNKTKDCYRLFNPRTSSMNVAYYIEGTSLGLKHGTRISYRTPKVKNNPNQFDIGLFLQTSDKPKNKETFNRVEYKFFGCYLGVSTSLHENINFTINTRTGVVNQDNFLITPSVLLEFKLYKFMQLETGVGGRNKSLSFQTGLKLSL